MGTSLGSASISWWIQGCRTSGAGLFSHLSCARVQAGMALVSPELCGMNVHGTPVHGKAIGSVVWSSASRAVIAVVPARPCARRSSCTRRRVLVGGLAGGQRVLLLGMRQAGCRSWLASGQLPLPAKAASSKGCQQSCSKQKVRESPHHGESQTHRSTCRASPARTCCATCKIRRNFKRPNAPEKDFIRPSLVCDLVCPVDNQYRNGVHFRSERHTVGTRVRLVVAFLVIVTALWASVMMT